jgi:capsular exopolysaccharide synthesis family protein
MAQSGLKTIIVDTDMRRPRIHKSFDQPNDVGLCNAILGESHITEVIKATPITNLNFLGCGPIPPNPAELLHGKEFAGVLDTLKSSYDRIILDSPPVGPVTDAVILATMTDGAILVIQANKNTIPEAKEMRNRLHNVQARILGVVLNKINLESNASKGYSYNYYYYKSGYYYTDEVPKKQASA